ncbi:hypothetical protein [uncultured Parabacteroides sp.]|uniref:hypothetical protein n=1 Tax=uncultured Parabacteroides sp. TaxID=512312 RepID=UPI00259B340B|nr:hypothetical protein [uncultured Parabacteroides sp.]
MKKNKGGLYIYQQIAKTKAEWEEENPIVPDRVWIFETDTERFKFGNGKDRYNDLKSVFEHGKEPRISEKTGNWEIWSRELWDWYDTGLGAIMGRAIDGGGPEDCGNEARIFDFGEI